MSEEGDKSQPGDRACGCVPVLHIIYRVNGDEFLRLFSASLTSKRMCATFSGNQDILERNPGARIELGERRVKEKNEIYILVYNYTVREDPPEVFRERRFPRTGRPAATSVFRGYEALIFSDRTKVRTQRQPR